VQDGSSKSRLTDSALFEVLCQDLGAPTFTIGSPEVVNLVGHTLQINEPFFFETTGTLPTGITDNTVYYVISAGYTANSFQFSTSVGGAAVNTTGSDSGTHKLRACPYGIPSATHFYLPDERGMYTRGAGANATYQTANGNFYNGGHVGNVQLDLMQGHIHNMGTFYVFSGFGGASPAGTTPASSFSQDTGGPLNDGTNGTPRVGNETRPVSRAVLVCIKY
jgi:hypothetical protein